MTALSDIKVIELVSVGPTPFAGMMLADMGADVIRIDRSENFYLYDKPEFDVLNRGKRSIALNLKDSNDLEILFELIKTADVLIEGYRPGTAERLGFGPDDVMKSNPRLIYGRMTGWGQEGSLADNAGHDINYISLTGTLDAVGEKGGKPQIPLNLIGDFGGGGMMFAFGITTALLEREKSGKGQVIDASMLDGTAALMASMRSMKDMGLWSLERGTNFTDSGAPFYQVYQCSDGKYISVGAVEHKFYQRFVAAMGLSDKINSDYMSQMDQSLWPELTTLFQQKIREKSQKQWVDIFDPTDCCVTPVLNMDECLHNEHNKTHNTYIEVDGVTQHRPTPRLSRTPGNIRFSAVKPDTNRNEILEEIKKG